MLLIELGNSSPTATLINYIKYFYFILSINADSLSKSNSSLPSLINTIVIFFGTLDFSLNSLLKILTNVLVTFPSPAYLNGSKAQRSLVHWYSNFLFPKSLKTDLYA